MRPCGRLKALQDMFYIAHVDHKAMILWLVQDKEWYCHSGEISYCPVTAECVKKLFGVFLAK